VIIIPKMSSIERLTKMKIINVVGARPNFMKVGPLMKVMDALIVHTGQHYDENMSGSFFRDLEIPKPDYNLGVGSGSHAVQTAKIMIKFEKVCLKERPDLVLVVGDVNSTIACALVAVKLGIKVAHVEAGLRSFDRTMPEEINRILTDSISDYLFVTEQSGMDNLKNEGIPDDKVFFVGDIMIDSLLSVLDKIKDKETFKKYGLEKENYVVSTLHRPSNVDNKEVLSRILDAFEHVQKKIKIVLALHPRTKKNIEKFGLNEKIKNIVITEPLDYINFMNLVLNCKFLLTDSGSIQSESTYLGKPCITIRENTERPVTITEGTNVLVGTDCKKIIEMSEKILNGQWKKGSIPKFYDGHTAERIVEALK